MKIVQRFKKSLRPWIQVVLYNTLIIFIKFSETLESEFSSQIINSIKLFVKHQIFDNKIFNTLDKNMFAFTQLRFFHNFIIEVILYYFKQAIIHLRSRKQFVSSSTTLKFATFLYELEVVFGTFRRLIEFFYIKITKNLYS